MEETCEDLQTATGAESRLRSRCASMEEKQRRDKEQIQVALYDVMQQIIKYTVDIVFAFCFNVCYLHKLVGALLFSIRQQSLT